MGKGRAQAKADLRLLGFRVNTRHRYRRAKLDYQRAKGLPRTGLADPITRRSLRRAAELNRAGKPDLSRYYSFREMECECGGRYADCRRVWPLRKLMRRLDQLREAHGGPLEVISGCRCPSHNRAIRGVADSQHKYGRAADIPAVIKAERVMALRLFTGIGTVRVTGKVAHVDVRTAGSTLRPIRWFY